MKRRNFLKTAGASALASGLISTTAYSFVPAHKWDRYDFGSGPPVKDRLNQGPFPIYPPEEVVPGSAVVMGTTPSKEIVNNYGMRHPVNWACHQKCNSDGTLTLKPTNGV